jgi:HEAT repeat protein
VPLLTEFARRPGYERLAAVVALARVTGNSEAALAVVLPALHATPEESGWAVRSLGLLGSAAAPAVPALLHLLDAAEDSARREVIEALGRIGPAASAAVPALLGALDEQVWWQGSPAIWALLRIGTEVPAALAAFPVFYWDEESRWTSYAEEETARQNREALAESPGAVQSLSDALGGDESTRLRAALTLSLMETAVPKIIPVLAEAASNDPPDGLLRLRVCAAKRLAALAPTAPIARTTLPILKAGLARVRAWALRGALHRAVARLENER